jgi:HK97 gp10 family phage protein
MANDLVSLQRSFDQVSFRAKRELATVVQAEAERLAEAIRAAAPVKTGTLRDSVKVRRNRGSLSFTIVAGGDATTKTYERDTGYESAVVIDGRDNRGIAKQSGGAGVTYDYSLSVEYGTSREHAEPFFFPTVRAMQDDIAANLKAAVMKAYRS